jgi:alkylation response protein AidB-like acyl-CoA dehydrogenase
MSTESQIRGRIGTDGRSSLACTRKILDIFEGTQQIQQLIVARRLLGKTSAELK